MKSDMFHKLDNTPNIHNTQIKSMNDEHLAGSGFRFQEFLKGVVSPLEIKDFPKFENFNDLNISVTELS